MKCRKWYSVKKDLQLFITWSMKCTLTHKAVYTYTSSSSVGLLGISRVRKNLPPVYSSFSAFLFPCFHFYNIQNIHIKRPMSIYLCTDSEVKWFYKGRVGGWWTIERIEWQTLGHHISLHWAHNWITSFNCDVVKS